MRPDVAVEDDGLHLESARLGDEVLRDRPTPGLVPSVDGPDEHVDSTPFVVGGPGHVSAPDTTAGEPADPLPTEGTVEVTPYLLGARCQAGTVEAVGLLVVRTPVGARQRVPSPAGEGRGDEAGLAG